MTLLKGLIKKFLSLAKQSWPEESSVISFYQVSDTDTYCNEDVNHVSPHLHRLFVPVKADWHVSSSAAVASFHGLYSQHPAQHLQKQQWEQFFSEIPCFPAFCTLSIDQVRQLSCTLQSGAPTVTSLKAEVDSAHYFSPWCHVEPGWCQHQHVSCQLLRGRF